MKNLVLLLKILLVLSLTGVLQAKPALVNINKADAAALQQSLVNIGPTRAEAIVKYRAKHGKFKSVSDLKKVPGIGDKLITKNKRYLSTSRGATKGDAKKYQAAKKAAKSKKSSSKKSSKYKSSKKSTSKKASSKKTSKKTTSKKASSKKSGKKTTSKKSSSKKASSKKSSKKSKKKKR